MAPEPDAQATNAPTRPSLSVVVPTSSGSSDLEACLESLYAEAYPGLQVVVVDNASPRSPAKLAERFPDVVLVRNSVNRGFAEPCNQGIEASTGELVLVLNDDTVIEPRALNALVDTLVARPSWGACQAKLLLLDDPSRLDTAGSFLTATGFLEHRGVFGPEDRFTESDEIFAAKGAALLLRRRAFEEAGGFDPDFFAYFEETDLCWRLWLAGWAVGYAADARVLHRLGATAGALDPALVQFHSFKNRISTLLTNLGPARLAWMLSLHLALCVALAAWYSARGRREVALAILRAIAWNVRHLPRTLRKRRRVQRRRRVDDDELFPRIAVRVRPGTFLSYARGKAGGSS